MKIIKAREYENMLPSLYPDKIREIKDEIRTSGDRHSFVLWNDILFDDSEKDAQSSKGGKSDKGSSSSKK